MADQDLVSGALVVAHAGETPSLELVIAAWLDAKVKRSRSRSTETIYRETLAAFRRQLQALGLDLDSDDERKLALVAQAFADTRDPERTRRPGQPVAPGTFNQRLAVLSSFYEFARRRRLLALGNPIETIERMRDQAYKSAAPLDPRDVAQRLAAIDRETLDGTRDYALLAVGLYTGRRLSELASLSWGAVDVSGGVVTLTFTRVKGGKVRRDRLSRAVGDALLRWVYRWYGAAIGQLPPEAPLWVSLVPNGRTRRGHALTARAISNICHKRLGTSRVHALRHTFAHGMEAVGAPVSEIQARLGHSSLQTTGRYLAALRSAENTHGEELTMLFGMK
jgi:integrase